MIKKINNNSGMADLFIQQAIAEKTVLFETKSEKIQKEIDALENSIKKQDSGLSSVEDRNELLYLKGELRHLEQTFYNAISTLRLVER